MHNMLEQGIKAARKLPEEQQNVAGELLMTLVARPELTSAQLEEVRLAQAEATQEAFATDEQVATFWERAGV